jgi:hypothetical protein
MLTSPKQVLKEKAVNTRMPVKTMTRQVEKNAGEIKGLRETAEGLHGGG